MIIAVDTGGTKTLVAAFSKDGELLHKIKFPTPKEVPLYISELVVTINKLTRETTPIAISLALPGILRHDGTLIVAENLGWKDVDIRQHLQKHFVCPIYIENDANLGGVGAVRLIPDTPARCLYVTISTGIGTGMLLNGQLLAGVEQSEGGRIYLEHDGVTKQWEEFASGRAVYNTYGKYAREITSKRVWNTISKNIAQGLLALWPVLRPEMIIIGGSIGTYFDRYDEHLNGVLREYLGYRAPLVVSSPKPEEVVIYGCYYYALDQLAA
jgi:predicted NBD/HSP70 family sugar kinase